jgi:hypothetical protein
VGLLPEFRIVNVFARRPFASIRTFCFVSIARAPLSIRHTIDDQAFQRADRHRRSLTVIGNRPTLPETPLRLRWFIGIADHVLAAPKAIRVRRKSSLAKAKAFAKATDGARGIAASSACF